MMYTNKKGNVITISITREDRENKLACQVRVDNRLHAKLDSKYQGNDWLERYVNIPEPARAYDMMETSDIDMWLLFNGPYGQHPNKFLELKPNISWFNIWCLSPKHYAMDIDTYEITEFDDDLIDCVKLKDYLDEKSEPSKDVLVSRFKDVGITDNATLVDLFDAIANYKEVKFNDEEN